MHIKDLALKRICIIGYGREGKAMAEALEEYAPGCRITIADKNKELRIKNYEVRSGERYLESLDGFDAIIKSPGIPPRELSTIHSSRLRPEPKSDYPLSTSTQIFFDSIKDSGATVVGITGSKGKSTTSSLIHHILKTSGKNSFLIGNIGEPAIKHIRDAKPNTIFVQELSSYQLMDLTVSPGIAVMTSFFPEHMDYHGTLKAYREAKKNIARFQSSEDHIYYFDDPDTKAITSESKGTKHSFRGSDAPVRIEETKLKGAHNLENIAAAFLVTTERLGVPREVAIAAIKDFVPLKHRLESLGMHDGIEWVNDSISTTPESAIAALDALGVNVVTLIAGGQDRGYDFSKLAKRLKSSSVKTLILLPDSGTAIQRAVEAENIPITCIEVKTMKEAVNTAKNCQLSIVNYQLSIVLLSPASPSYGHFKNFEDRGEQFKQEIYQ